MLFFTPIYKSNNACAVMTGRAFKGVFRHSDSVNDSDDAAYVR